MDDFEISFSSGPFTPTTFKYLFWGTARRNPWTSLNLPAPIWTLLIQTFGDPTSRNATAQRMDATSPSPTTPRKQSHHKTTNLGLLLHQVNCCCYTKLIYCLHLHQQLPLSLTIIPLLDTNRVVQLNRRDISCIQLQSATTTTTTSY